MQPPSGLGKHDLIAFVSIVDVERAKQFYRSGYVDRRLIFHALFELVAAPSISFQRGSGARGAALALAMTISAT